MNNNLWLKVFFLILCFAGPLWIHAQITEIPGKERAFLKIDARAGTLSIYFNPNSRDIPESVVSYIDQLVGFMNDHPESTFVLDSYTDSQGGSDYNLSLSESRAETFMAVLVQNGMDQSRVKVKGYGESKIINHCRDGIKCTAEEHRQNRRIDLRINSTAEKAAWEKWLQTLENELGPPAKPTNKPSSKRLPEANNSVPLPAFKPSDDNFSERGESAAPAPAPRRLQDQSFSTPNGVSPVQILPLSPNFRGFAIELVRSNTELPSNHAAFKGQKEVFRLLEKDNKISYLLVNLGSQQNATAFYKSKIKPANREAKLVRYSDIGKVYLPD
jgi:hypothetical protein